MSADACSGAIRRVGTRHGHTRANGWSGLFATAFRQSRNAMALVDGQRRHVDVNGAYVQLLGYPKSALIGRPIYHLVAGGPQLSAQEWANAIAMDRFEGETELVRADGSSVAVGWGASAETVTGRRLVLFVALTISRRHRPVQSADWTAPEGWRLSNRQREIVHLVSLGFTGPEIAEELHVAHDTVRTHVRNAMAASGARSRAHLVAIALAGGHALG
jgi:PAS domain S-box-containing protein